MITKSPNFRNLKLTEEAVIDIITDTTATADELAARYGIQRQTVYNICNGKKWKHITLDPKYTPRNFKLERKKLNVDIVTAIKNHTVTDLKAVAKEYGVALKYLQKLRDPNYIDAWKTIPTKEFKPSFLWRKRLTDEEIIGICSEQGPMKVVARKYNVHPSTVKDLRNGRKHKHITCDPRYAYKKGNDHVQTGGN